jgi:hypothetical protein
VRENMLKSLETVNIAMATSKCLVTSKCVVDKSFGIILRLLEGYFILPRSYLKIHGNVTGVYLFVC